MVSEFHRPRDAAEALALLGSKAGALALGGGTQILSAEFRDRSIEVVALAGLLPGTIRHGGGVLEMGAAATFQDLVDFSPLPLALRSAAEGMVDRNIRNRATLGGNLGADKSCSSLVPLLLALDAELELLDGRQTSLEKWLDLPPGPRGRGIISTIRVRMAPGLLAGYARWTRVSCDLSILGASVAYRIEGGLVRDLRLALGGMAAHARLFPAIAALFEGKRLQGRDAVEAAVAPLLAPIGDARASVEFKRLRCSGLVAEALAGAVDITREVTR